MQQTGPQLDTLTHWLADCPPEFYQSPIDSGGAISRRADDLPINVAAIVSDHLRDLGMPLAAIRQVGGEIGRLPSREQRLVSICVWLLREPWFMQHAELAGKVGELLGEGLGDLSRTIKPESTVTDPDRREELVRLVLGFFGYRPAGETLAQARDRMNTLDSVERVRIVSQTRDAEARARAIRQAMAQKGARGCGEILTGIGDACDAAKRHH